ncbi:hypothetical protein LDENG_00066240 [Lucifuga dentata]|nr:hypothetical protein LDENG_00066240 [Lucifuga dentata]
MIIVYFLSTVSNRAVVTVEPDWQLFTSSESITLTCEIEGGGDTEWEYQWITPTSNTTLNHIVYRISSASVSDRGDYWCRGTHTGDSFSSTEWSEAITLLVSDVHSPAFITVSPNRVQHFIREFVSLTCEGNLTEWTVKRFTKAQHVTQCSYWGMMARSSCVIDTSEDSNAVYWCETGSGQYSSAINITVQNRGIILVSPVHPVTEGDSVTLGCNSSSGLLVSNVAFYQNGKLVQNDTRGEMTIPAVSATDEGFYKCEHSGAESPQSWMAVKCEYE